MFLLRDGRFQKVAPTAASVVQSGRSSWVLIYDVLGALRCENPICNALQPKKAFLISTGRRGTKKGSTICPARSGMTSILKKLEEQGLILSWALGNPELEKNSLDGERGGVLMFYGLANPSASTLLVGWPVWLTAFETAILEPTVLYIKVYKRESCNVRYTDWCLQAHSRTIASPLSFITPSLSVGSPSSRLLLTSSSLAPYFQAYSKA